MFIAGIDIGTTGCKCTVYSKQGLFLEESYREYNSEITEEGHILKPLVVWNSIKEVIKETVEKVGKIDIIGVTSFGEAAILLDEKDNPLMDSLLYTDPRGKYECEELVKFFGKNYMNKITGLNPDSMYTISKIMWIKKHRPELFELCKRICLFEDYIVYMLTGICQIDYSLATRTMAFDINGLQWDDKILEFAKVKKELFSKVVPIGTKAGNVKLSLANELGLGRATMVVSGCHDQIAAAIGTGVYKEGMAVDGTGTVECITNVFNGNNFNVNKEMLYKGSYAIVPFLNDMSIAYAFSFTGGALLKWYRDKLVNMEKEIINNSGKSSYDYFNEKVDMTKPSGLLVLPYFAGAGTPNMDGTAKGGIIGLTLDTSSSDIYKALMEGVTYEMRLNIEKLSEAGIEIDSIRATGGGASSEIWLQIKADILKKPVISLGAAQSGTLGSIMLAGLACGIYTSMEEAEKVFVKLKKTYVPNECMSKKYDEIYEKYTKAYDLIKNIM
ncbi:FGGY-family carbohydrate kinase [Clostridium grantii]|uniref:Xylulokinase n=1 Tax=Clostridium grantii DSM 8605 TaxID=1121316 RepID=A0A1M5WF69_9CLOT|nr:FGGY-family carbohydrate kinase [Clostridium grantii]SHH86136.1 xylulokinase [Clostridium grantii DSM 8605]